MEIDVERLICSLLSQGEPYMTPITRGDIEEALKEQGLNFTEENGIAKFKMIPMFKVGDVIAHKYNSELRGQIKEISDYAYYFTEGSPVGIEACNKNYKLVEKNGE